MWWQWEVDEDDFEDDIYDDLFDDEGFVRSIE